MTKFNDNNNTRKTMKMMSNLACCLLFTIVAVVAIFLTSQEVESPTETAYAATPVGVLDESPTAGAPIATATFASSYKSDNSDYRFEYTYSGTPTQNSTTKNISAYTLSGSESTSTRVDSALYGMQTLPHTTVTAESSIFRCQRK